MTLQIKTSHHLDFSILLAIKLIQRDKKIQQEILSRNGKFLPNDEAIKELHKMHDGGLQFLPMCDNTDEVGHCLGHTN